MQDAPREDGFEFAMAPIPTENADDVHYVFDSCEQFSIPAAAKNPELAKEFLRDKCSFSKHHLCLGLSMVHTYSTL